MSSSKNIGLLMEKARLRQCRFVVCAAYPNPQCWPVEPRRRSKTASALKIQNLLNLEPLGESRSDTAMFSAGCSMHLGDTKAR